MPNSANFRQPFRLANKTKLDFQTKFTLFLMFGYFFIGKLFVYASFPLAALVAVDPKVLAKRVYSALTQPSPLSGLTWSLLISTLAGLAGVIYGLLSGYSAITTFEVFAFNLCPWFLFFGIHAGTQRPFMARSVIRFLAWYHAITTPLYYVALRNVPFFGGDDGILQPGSGAVVLLGIFCFEPNLRRYWFPILICAFDTIAAEIRADWVGLAVAVTIWAIAAKKLGRVAAMAGMLAAFLAIGFVADVRIPGLPGRGGEISARDTVARALSSVAPDLAYEYSPNSRVYAGTVQWRENWWKAIRAKVFEEPSTTIFGLGYGYPIKDLVSYLKGGDIRSPHSVLYFTLAYSGVLGVLLFAIFQANLLLVLWRVYKKTGQIFGFASVIFILIGACFGNFYEAPQRSVPPYIVWGLCIGPLLLAERRRTESGPILLRRKVRPGQGRWPRSRGAQLVVEDLGVRQSTATLGRH